MEVLRTKNPEARLPSAASQDTYPDRPMDLFLVYIMEYTVMEVTGHLSGGAGPGGMDSASLQHWLLIFVAASGELRLMVVEFEEWIANGQPT